MLLIAAVLRAGALERVVGSARAKKMLRNADTPTFMFC